MESYQFIFFQAILLVSAFVLFILMIIAFRKIMKDVNDILDQTDKWIFFLSSFQQILLFTYLLTELVLFLSGLRLLRLLQEIILLNCLCKLNTDYENCLNISDKLTKLFSLCLIIGWGLLLLFEGITSYYQCYQQIWLLSSILMVFIALLQLYFAMSVLIQIHNYWRDQGTQHMFDGLHRIMMDELQNRKVQVSIFIFCSVVSSTIMMIFDYSCFQNITIIQNIINLLMIFLIYQLPCFGIYYVYYLKNIKYLNVNNSEMQRNIINFYDERSEIALADYQNQL